MSSPYMHWAKTRQTARYTLAVSGIKGLTLPELQASWDDLALDGTPGYGMPTLREALAEKSGVDASRIVLATGTSGANHLVLAALLESGDDVVIERPGYEPLERLAEHLGGVLRFFPRRVENDFKIDPTDVAAAMTSKTKAIVLSSLHNPSSVATDEATMRAIGAIASKAGAVVVSDEAYLDAAFEHAPPSAGTLGPAFVATTSLTKVFGLGGLRCGWIVADPALAEKMWQLKNLFGVNEVHPAGGLALRALARSGEILARARTILDTNRKAWHAFLDTRSDLAVARLGYGTTSFVRLLAADADAVAQHLREKYETSIVPGRFFGSPEYLRIGLCGDTEIFKEGLARFGRALDDLRVKR
jgi:aspartate/methionine/tyrosine aminotransferase